MYTNVTTMKMPSNHLNNDFVKLTGQSLKNAKIPVKHINFFLKHLFQKSKSKSKSTDKNQESSQPLDNERNR